MSDNKDVANNDVDPELEDLLDSALQDMTKKPEPVAADNQVASADGLNQNVWSEEFIKEAAAQFETNMAAILGGFSGVPEDQITQEQIAETFTKMAVGIARPVFGPIRGPSSGASNRGRAADCGVAHAPFKARHQQKQKAAAKVLKPSGDNAAVTENSEPTDPVIQNKIDEVSAAISQTLQNLNSNAESLQTPITDQDLANMFSSFSLDGAQDGNMFVPFMQGMMQSLLSKDVLYPSLKELCDKYPSWLEDNKATLEQSEYERFCKQQELMQQVCNELEPERETDPEEVKRKRTERVLELMQKMQELGQPPLELVGDAGAPPLPAADSAQCRIM